MDKKTPPHWPQTPPCSGLPHHLPIKWRLYLLSSYAAPPLSEVTMSAQPPRTTAAAAATTTTTTHRGLANTTITTGQKQGSRGEPRPPPVAPQTTSPPPLESFPLPERFCKATEERDIMWPETPRGMLVERPCPRGTRGKQASLCFVFFRYLCTGWPLKYRKLWSKYLLKESVSSGGTWLSSVVFQNFEQIYSSFSRFSVREIMCTPNCALQISNLLCFGPGTKGFCHCYDCQTKILFVVPCWSRFIDVWEQLMITIQFEWSLF